MSAFKVLITDGLEDKGQTILRSGAQVDDRTGIPPRELLDIVGEYEALIVRSRTKVTEGVLEKAKRLRVIGRAGVGVDSINLEAAKEHKVTVVNAPRSTSLAVAELTLGLMLSMAREIPRADSHMKAGEWIKKDLRGIELSGKALGILGMGRIGTQVANRAAAFSMDVLGHDPHLTRDEIAYRGAEPVELEDLYARSDFISLHLPLTDVSRSMLNQEAFGRMRRGVRIVCAARGGIIDESALLAALQSGQVAGAALDVFSAEPPGATDLVRHPKVIATPHLGAQTRESQTRAAEDIAVEVLAALNGEPLRWKVQ